MNSNAILALATLGSFVLAMLLAIFGMTIGATRRVTLIEAHIEAMQLAIAEHVSGDRLVHEAMMQDAREDRKASNERLTFLERREMER